MAILVAMSRRMLKVAILLAVIAAVIEAIRRTSRSEPAAPAAAPPWTPLGPSEPDTGPAPVAESNGTTRPADTAWVAPAEDGSCPTSHPLKAKESSKIVHQPGGLSYDRTRPDRCYVDLTAAESDGYRPAKR